MDYLFPSRTRKRLQTSSPPSDTSSLDEDDDESQSRNSNHNKRSRRLSENSASSAHLPLLQQAQTFETSSTRSSSSSSSSPLSISSSSNDSPQQQQQQHNHEYYSAISAAKSRLTAAQATHTSSISMLQHAQHQYQSSSNELRNAKLFLRGVEEKWGVIMLDCEDDESYNDDIDNQEKHPEEVIVPMMTRRGGGRGQRIDRDEEGVLQPPANMNIPATTAAATAAATESATAESTIEITSSGEALVNGTYYPINNTTTSSSSSSSSVIYINSSGPYHIHNQYYDVCLFPKVGYGMKFRWCLGLVPCTYHDDGRGVTGGDDDGGGEEERGVGSDRTRDFALAFIYYWTMDLPVQCSSSGNSRSDGGEADEDDQEEEGVLEYYLPLSSMQWGACHGLRPLPNISFGRKRWWQFWRT